MKTLVIVSHPEIEESSSQQYLLESFPKTEAVTYHHLEGTYPDGKIDVTKEQELVREYDRIIFQFPFYWYTSPPMLKHWQDEVLLEHFAYGVGGYQLKNKELGLVLVIGVGEKEYQVGGNEGYTISSLTTPYQAMAKKLGMTFLKPLAIHQFQYMKEKEQMRLLIKYQQYLMMENFDSLKSRENWFLNEIENIDHNTLPESSEFILDQVTNLIDDHRMELDEMRMHIDNYEF